MRLSRVPAALAYAWFILVEVVRGSWRVVRAAFDRAGVHPAAIVEFPLRCRSDVEVTVLASSITITPGTLVLGTAPGEDGRAPTLFVHALFASGRQEVLDGLRDMESRLLRVTRGPHADRSGGPS